MLRHNPDNRTIRHHLKIAALFSLVAGIVNIVGFLYLQRLTTNLTGHFAFLIDEILQLHLGKASIFALYLLAFFAGSFFSNFLVELALSEHKKYVFTLPVLIELCLLTGTGISVGLSKQVNVDFLAGLLLFSMGLQNSLVTKISNAHVRTTHLTGIFTDLGIDFSKLFFSTQTQVRKKIYLTIKLRSTIVFFFLAGGLLGGLLYLRLGFKVIFLASVILLIGLIFDPVRYYFLKALRTHQGR